MHLRQILGGPRQQLVEICFVINRVCRGEHVGAGDFIGKSPEGARVVAEYKFTFVLTKNDYFLLFDLMKLINDSPGFKEKRCFGPFGKQTGGYEFFRVGLAACHANQQHTQEHIKIHAYISLDSEITTAKT